MPLSSGETRLLPESKLGGCRLRSRKYWYGPDAVGQGSLHVQIGASKSRTILGTGSILATEGRKKLSPRGPKGPTYIVPIWLTNTHSTILLYIFY
jgi:hypothetical protein